MALRPPAPPSRAIPMALCRSALMGPAPKPYKREIPPAVTPRRWRWSILTAPRPPAPTITGYPSGAVQVGADGTVAQTIPTGVSTRTVMVVRPDGTTTNVLVGDTWGPAQVGADGTVTKPSCRGTHEDVCCPSRWHHEHQRPIMATPNGRCGSAPMGPPIKPPLRGTPPAATSRR